MARISGNRTRTVALGVALGLTAWLVTLTGGAPAIATNVSGSRPAPARAAHPPASAASAAAAPKTEAGRSGDIVQLLGDAPLRGQIDLSRIRLEDGRYVAPLGDGRTAILTLHPDIQKAAEKALARAKAPRGAIVVTATDGTILALAGRRHGEPPVENDYAQALDVWAPAASVFKIVTASALVANGVSPGKRVCYHGGIRSVTESNLTDSSRDRACDDLAYGLAKSQNAIIAKLAHRHLEPGALSETAARFGFQDAPEFALECDENRCTIPKKPLEFAKVSAGFWNSELSPLGGALLANTIATGGLRATPRIVSEVLEDGRVTTRVGPEEPERVIGEGVARKVAEMMVATTESGTARRGFHDRRGRKFLPDVAVGGKTGTLTRDDPSYLEFSWFVGFAPADEPEISIAVLLGNPPRWHLKGHTAARLVLQEIF